VKRNVVVGGAPNFSWANFSSLAELEHAEHELKRTRESQRRLEQEPVWDWATRNLRAAADRLLSPAERIERAAEPVCATRGTAAFERSVTD
jgi:hypothetical protein